MTHRDDNEGQSSRAHRARRAVRRPGRASALLGAAVAVLAAGLLAAEPASATPSGSASPNAGNPIAPVSAPTVSDDPVAFAKASASTQWVRTPAGLEHQSCVHALPKGSRLAGNRIISSTGQSVTVPACRYPRLVKPGSTAGSRSQAGHPTPATNGWMAASWWGAPTWLSRLSANFTVPGDPGQNGATNFFFPSFEPSAGNAIIQPVLSHGGSAAGGGDYWYITSWYVGPAGTFYGNNVTVAPGHNIYGEMTSSNCAGDGTNCDWTIITRDTSAGGAQSTLTLKTSESWSTAQGGVLESYGASNCSMLPSGGVEPFVDIAINGSSGQPVTPSFGRFVPDSTCGADESATEATTHITWNTN